MFGVDQSVRANGVEVQHPIANRLQADAADPRRRAARGAGPIYGNQTLFDNEDQMEALLEYLKSL